jgi:hypothetical protein
MRRRPCAAVSRWQAREQAVRSEDRPVCLPSIIRDEAGYINRKSAAFYALWGQRGDLLIRDGEIVES